MGILKGLFMSKVQKEIIEKNEKLKQKNGWTKEEWEKSREEIAGKRKGEKSLEKIEKLEYLENNKIAHCPKCNSESVMPVKKGFSVGKAITGAVLTGGIGLVAGGIGANKIEMVCMNCGHKYKHN